jgi:hypothetical protein
LIQQKSSELNRLQKFFEDANIKLSSMVSDLHGPSARGRIQHWIQNDLDPKEALEKLNEGIDWRMDLIGRSPRG